MTPLWLRIIYCRAWNKLHGYPRGSISEDGSIVTLSTGKCPDNWFYRVYKKEVRNAD